MMRKLILIPIALLILFACQNTGKEINIESEIMESAPDNAVYKVFGDSITTIAQATLMSNVMTAVKEGGFAHAVQFCNVEAIPLTTNAVEGFGGSIERISDRNRNPDNYLKTATDKAVFKYFQEEATAKDTLAFVGNEYVYYKRINLAMENCLNCHGDKGVINSAALTKIQELYPKDKAQGYHLNDLRGAWKVSIPNNTF